MVNEQAKRIGERIKQIRMQKKFAAGGGCWQHGCESVAAEQYRERPLQHDGG